MMKIILTLQQKTDLEAGNPYGPNSSTLLAWPIMDGTFVLPPAVINDPDFASIHDILAELPQRDVNNNEYFPDEQ